jgi:opacity protein-like surface antigen
MRNFLAVILVLFTASVAHAQSVGDQPAMAIKAGSAALMFDMGGLFTSAPTSFEGIGVGGRYAVVDRLHLRGAVGMDKVTKEMDFEGSDTTYEDQASSFALEGGVDYILVRNANLLVYLGGIFQAGFAVVDPDGQGYDGEDNDVSYSNYTVAALLGANWFFTQNVSLGAEYRFGLQMSTAKDDGDKATDTRLGTGSAAFQLGFWF